VAAPPRLIAIAALAIAWSMGIAGLRGGDPASAAALADWARADPEPMAASGVDAARELVAVRPWQPGFAASRAELDAITSRRTAATRSLR
jgi:hypothetical protein